MTEPANRSNRQKVSTGFLWLVAALLATYLGLSLPLPYKITAPVFAVVAIVVVLRVLRLASRERHAVLAWIVGIVGMLGAIFYGGAATVQIILWDATVQYEQCISQALTDTAQTRCESEYLVNFWD